MKPMQQGGTPRFLLALCLTETKTVRYLRNGHIFTFSKKPFMFEHGAGTPYFRHLTRTASYWLLHSSSLSLTLHSMGWTPLRPLEKVPEVVQQNVKELNFYRTNITSLGLVVYWKKCEQLKRLNCFKRNCGSLCCPLYGRAIMSVALPIAEARLLAQKLVTPYYCLSGQVYDLH